MNEKLPDRGIITSVKIGDKETPIDPPVEFSKGDRINLTEDGVKVEATVQGFKTEADALRFVCRQVLGLGQDLKAGRNDEFKKRLTAIYEFAENYLETEE